MVRVKLVKEKVWSHETHDWEYTEEGEYIGKVFDAFKIKNMVDDKEKITYNLDFGDGIYFADAIQVEELDPSLDYSDEVGTESPIRTIVESQPRFTRVSTQPQKVLLFEDGSVDFSVLEDLGIPYICYRRGCKPEIIEI